MSQYDEDDARNPPPWPRRYAEADLQFTVTMYEMGFMPFWRMMAHFDALDGDDDPIEGVVMGRYELMHPEDHWEMPNFAKILNEQLFNAFILGTPMPT